MSLQIHAWRIRTNASTSGTNYIAPLNGQTPSATEHQGTCICTAVGSFGNWVITLDVAPGAGKSWTFTLRKNQVDTGATITISGTSTSGSYTGTAITLAADDELAIKIVPSGTPASSGWSTAWEFNSTTSAESIHGSGNTAGTLLGVARTNRVLFPVDTSNWDAGNRLDIVACAGTITKATIKLDVQPSTGSVTFTLAKNGVPQDGTSGTPDTRISFTGTTVKATTTFSLSVSPGDQLTWLFTVSVALVSITRPITGIKFVATTAGQSNYSSNGANVASGATEYWPLGAGGATTNATESVITNTLGLTGMYLANMQVALNGAPGLGNAYQFNLRKNAGSGSNSVTINDPAATGSNSTSTRIGAGNTFDLEVVPSGTPITRGFGVSWIQSQTGGGGGAGKGHGGGKKGGGGGLNILYPSGATIINIGNPGIDIGST